MVHHEAPIAHTRVIKCGLSIIIESTHHSTRPSQSVLEHQPSPINPKPAHSSHQPQAPPQQLHHHVATDNPVHATIVLHSSYIFNRRAPLQHVCVHVRTPPAHQASSVCANFTHRPKPPSLCDKHRNCCTTVATMLLPSAIGCDGSAPKTRYQSSLLASPPLSPPASSHPTLYSTCRALQSMLTTPRLPSPLPSPPTTHAEMPASPFKLRLRTRNETSTSQTPRMRITKRAAPPPRGINKRRRAVDDDRNRSTPEQDVEDNFEEYSGPSTPKRMRIAPEVLPLGLERSDFHTLELQQRIEQDDDDDDDVLESIEDHDDDEWSTEEDRILVELVLEKLKLSKSEWQDCARSLGKDRGSVGKRWKSLMSAGEIGVKDRGARRSRIHSTWR